MDTVDITASEYEWKCPECGTRNIEKQHTEQVTCSNPQCFIVFETKDARKATLEWIDEQCDKLDDSYIRDCNCFRLVQRIIGEKLNNNKRL